MEDYKIGEIKKGREIGKDTYRKYIWLECPKCHKRRWVDMTHYRLKGQRQDITCQHCNGRMQGKINSRKSSFKIGGNYDR